MTTGRRYHTPPTESTNLGLNEKGIPRERDGKGSNARLNTRTMSHSAMVSEWTWQYPETVVCSWLRQLECAHRSVIFPFSFLFSPVLPFRGNRERTRVRGRSRYKKIRKKKYKKKIVMWELMSFLVLCSSALKIM